ncbi:hypothetical protein LSAT2_016731 [Lamellibrachia satsuma]|nr:hypothetical protein LSAT2_016731 [Lamellibrachia satsuma]
MKRLMFLIWLTAVVLASEQISEIVDEQLKECKRRCLAKWEDCYIWLAPAGPVIYYSFYVLRCEFPYVACEDECKRRANIRNKKPTNETP